MKNDLFKKEFQLADKVLQTILASPIGNIEDFRFYFVNEEDVGSIDALDGDDAPSFQLNVEADFVAFYV